jgi:hypothetical protein
MLMWTGEDWKGAKDVRYGRFVSVRMGISVNLPMDEVIVQK